LTEQSASATASGWMAILTPIQTGYTMITRG